MKIKNKEKCIITLICAVCLCLWGGIYDFTMAIYGCIFAIGIIIVMSQKRKILLPANITCIGLVFILVCSLMSTFIARDHGIAFIGFLRCLVIVEFWLLWCNISKQKRESVWDILPDLLALITLASIVLYFIPAAREYLYSAKRLGGVLQYSNTYAALLLVGFIVLIYREEKKKIDYMEGIILIAGILMTGSRSVFVLMLVSICFLLLKKKIPLKYFGIGFTGAVAVLIILQLLMNLDITRLLKMTINSSTLNGRILYWYDGIRQLLKNPFGLGYMGYFFKQPEFQTGNYVIRYVHNDFLQMGLDNGIISLIVFVVIVLGGAFSKKICGRNRLILIVLALHSFFDFDLQYGFMFCILLMTLDTESKKVCECKKAYGYGVVSVMMAISVYFSLALGFEHFGKSQAALTLYPADTFALQDELNENGDAAVAEMIIEKNGMIASAYEIVASDEADNGNYNASMKHLDDMLKYAGYDGYYYNQAVFYYSKCLDTAVRSEDIEATRDILNKITQMPQLIAQKEADASTFAQRINDKPKIELTDDIQNYIEKMSEIKFTD